MNFLKSLFKKKEEPIRSYDDFWRWFANNQKELYKVVKEKKDVEKDFLDKLSPKLEELRDGFYYLTGMYDDATVELIISAEGSAKNIVFVEELIGAAPKLKGWKFTALKPSLDIENVSIATGGQKFDKDNLSFYATEHAQYPDEIDITIVHNDLTEENKNAIIFGSQIFLDNYLGELEFLNNIDNLKTIGTKDAERELIPIAKLKDYLNWRQKEFVEKYEGVRYDTDNDTFTVFEAKGDGGKALIAVIDTELLTWDSKASHPWISILTLQYDGSNNNGLPNDEDLELFEKIETEIAEQLKDYDGYLYIGRQNGSQEREIYYACKDFRKPSKVFFDIQQRYSQQFEIDYDIFKDKYWLSFKRFEQ